MLNGDEKFVKSGSVRLWAERYGDPADAPVLLIMGTAEQGIGWPDELVEALARAGRQVLRFDHRDTGRPDVIDFGRDPYTLTAIMTSPMGYSAGLSRITAPTLVVHGTADPLLSPEHGMALAALIPGATFRPVDGMGHGFFSPGLPTEIAHLIATHSGTGRP